MNSIKLPPPLLWWHIHQRKLGQRSISSSNLSLTSNHSNSKQQSKQPKTDKTPQKHAFFFLFNNTFGSTVQYSRAIQDTLELFWRTVYIQYLIVYAAARLTQGHGPALQHEDTNTVSVSMTCRTHQILIISHRSLRTKSLCFKPSERVIDDEETSAATLTKSSVSREMGITAYLDK